MSGKIDGVPRDLIEDALAIATTHASANWSAEVRDRLRALLDAPVVERQPVDWRALNAYGEVVTEWIDGAPPTKLTDLEGSPASYDKIELAYTEQLAPVAPEEPIAYMRNEGEPNNLVKCTFACPGAFGVYASRGF